VLLTDVGREIARRGEDVLTASRDLVDFARHRGGLLTGRLMLGVIPSLAPSTAADSSSAANPFPGIAAGATGNPDPAIGRGHQER
jgi:DNA-binding transcriptional LysR family regulator